MKRDRNGRYTAQPDCPHEDDLLKNSDLQCVIAARQRLTEYASNHTFAEVLQKAAYELCDMTGSTLCFFHVFAQSDVTDRFGCWWHSPDGGYEHINFDFCFSDGTLPERWRLSIEQGVPTCQNDSDGSIISTTYPPGCGQLQRELILPVRRNNRTLALFGVADTADCYSLEDSQMCSIFADLAWDIAWIKQLEEKVGEGNEPAVKSEVEQSILDNIHLHLPIGFGLLDLKRRFHRPNRQLSLITGYSLEELEGMPVRRLYASRDEYERVLRDKIDNLSRSGTSEIITEWVRKDGARVNVILNAVYKNPDNPAEGIIGTVRDVSANQRSLEALRQSENKYKMLFENAVAGIFQSTPEGRFLSVNRAFAEMLGYGSPDELVNTIRDISSQYYFNPEDRRRYQELLHKSGRVENFELKVKRKDGSVIAVSNNTYAYFDKDGEVLFYEGTLVDITERKAAEEELTRIFAMSIDLICIADIQTASFLKVNPAFQDTLGYSEEELIGTPFLDFVHPDDADKTDAIVRERLMEGARVIDFENRFRCKDGSYRWLSWVSHPDEQNEKTYAVARDITEWKKAEEKLKESKALLDFTGQMARIGGWELDARTMKVSWTEETYRIHEVPFDYQPPLDEALNYYHPDDRPKLSKAIERALGDGTPYDMEVRFITARGKRLWTRTKCEPQQVGGKVVKLRGVFQDITARKTAEERLETQNRLMSTLLDNLQVGVFMVEAPSGKTLLINNKAKELLGRGFAGDTETATLAEVYQAYKYGTDQIYPTEEMPIVKAMQGEHHAVDDMIIHKPDGRKVHLHVFGSPVWDQNGKVAASIVSFFDITSRKKAEEERELLQHQLAQSQKMESIGRLTGGVAHDFNNILGVIIGYTEMALETVNGDTPLHGDLQKILDAAVRSSDIVRQLLAFSRQQPISPKILDLNKVVEGTLKMLKHLIGEEIELSWHPFPDLAKVKMDPSQVDQILANLCVNARDAIVGTGSVSISTGMTTITEEESMHHTDSSAGTFVQLIIRDDGSGIAGDQLENIFEPFYTTKEVGKGTGLGLAMVYGIVKQNNGFIKVDSVLGEGTTFTLHIPGIEDDGKSLKDTLKKAVRDGRGETVLVVEDESAVLAMTVSMLQRSQFNVLAATSPSEAMRLANDVSENINLVLTDIVMPEMNGKELVDRLREKYPDIKVLFMSGYTGDVISHRGVLEKEVHFLQKPFTRNELVLKVNEILDS